MKKPLLLLLILILLAACQPDTAVTPQPTTAVFITNTPAPTPEAQPTEPAATPISEPSPALPATVLSAGEFPASVAALAADANDQRVVYALLTNNALYKTADQGQTWSLLPFPAPILAEPETAVSFTNTTQRLRLVGYSDPKLYVLANSTLYEGAAGGTAWRALTDHVTTWTDNDSFGGEQLLFLWRDGKALPENERGLYQHRLGDTMEQLSIGRPDGLTTSPTSLLYDSLRTPYTYLLGGEDGLFISQNGGRDFLPFNQGLPNDKTAVLSLFSRFGRYALVAHDGAVSLASLGDDATRLHSEGWLLQSDLSTFLNCDPNGEPLCGIYDISDHPGNRSWVYLATQQGVFKSEDHGQTWEPTPIQQPIYRLALSNVSRNTLGFFWAESGWLVENPDQDSTAQAPPPEVSGTFAVSEPRYFGGNLTATALIDDEMVLVAEASRLYALDIGDRASPQPLGEPLPLSGVVQELRVADGYAYAALPNAVAILDISNPAAPSQVSQFSFSGSFESLAIDGEMVYVAANGRLQLFDVSDKAANIQEVSTFLLPRRIWAMAPVEDGYLYISYAGGLLVLDVADPTAVEQLFQLERDELGGDILIHDQVAYIGGYGLTTFDIADPTVPEIVDTDAAHTPPIDKLVLSADDILYSAYSFCEFGFCSGNLYPYDISQPDNPVSLLESNSSGLLEISDFSIDLLAIDDWLLLGGSESLQIIDAEAPRQPQVVGQYALFGEVDEIAFSATGATAFVTGDTAAGVIALDVSDPVSWREIGRFPSNWSANPTLLNDNTLALTGWNEGLRLLDISDPTAIRQLTQLDYMQLDGTPEKLRLLESGLLAVNLGNGVILMDASNPAAVQESGRFTWDYGLFSWRAVAEAGELLLLSGDDNAEPLSGQLRLLDASDPSSISDVGSLTLPGRGGDVVIVGDTAFVVWNETDCYEAACPGGIVLVDISTPSQPQLLETISLQRTDSLALAGETLFVGTGTAVWVFDVSQPQAPQATGKLSISGTSSHVTVHDNTLYVASGSGGMTIFDLP